MIWAILIISGMLTFLTRVIFIALYGKIQTPPLVQQALRFVPPAVLTAIIFQELFIRNGSLALSWSNPRPFVGLLAALVAWKTRSALWTIAIGGLAMVLIQIF